jgi:hypothetical protein
MLLVAALATAFALGFGGKARAQHGHLIIGGGHYGAYYSGQVYPSQASFQAPGQYQSLSHHQSLTRHIT